MRIEGFNPLLPTIKAKDDRKPSTTPSQVGQDQFLHTVENTSTYSAPSANKDQQLQVKNYVTTVLFRQNWVEKSSRLNAQVLRSTAGIDFQDTAYWKPEQVGKRILNFAKSLGSTDSSKIDSLKESALKGLDDSAKMLGGMNGTLQKTQEQVISEFDAWKEQLQQQ